MRLGRLDRRVTIYRLPSPAPRDELNEPVRAWLVAARLWAQQLSQRPVESWKAGQSAAQAETVWRLRWSGAAALIGPGDRMVCDGQTYDVIGTSEPQRRAVIEVITIATTDNMPMATPAARISAWLATLFNDF